MPFLNIIIGSPEWKLFPKGVPSLSANCDHCNTLIWKTKHQAYSSIRNKTLCFCKNNCYAAFKSKNNKITHICPICNISFTRIKGYLRKRKHEIICCSNQCRSKYWGKIISERNRIIYNCKQCGKEFNRIACRDKRGTNKFCSPSCAGKYVAKNCRTSSKRSKAEVFLCELIKKDFPSLIISENNHNILPSKLEIDIFIKHKNLAIEVNGPFHYFPIFGQDYLDKIHNKDIKKQNEILALKINLIILDISNFLTLKQTKSFILDQYNMNIKPILSLK